MLAEIGYWQASSRFERAICRPEPGLSHLKMSRRPGAPDLAQHVEVQAFDLVARPGRLAQEFQAGGDAGFAGKAADVDALAQAVPTVVRRQRGDDGFELDAVQRVARLLRVGGWRQSASGFVRRRPGGHHHHHHQLICFSACRALEPA